MIKQSQKVQASKKAKKYQKPTTTATKINTKKTMQITKENLKKR